MAQIIYPELSYDVQGAFFEVHNALGQFDLSEAGWEEALAIALNARGIVAHRQVEMRLRQVPFEKINEVVVQFRGQPIERCEVPLLVVGDRLLVVPLAVVSITPWIIERYRQFLKLLGINEGVIVNFHSAKLEAERVAV